MRIIREFSIQKAMRELQSKQHISQATIIKTFLQSKDQFLEVFFKENVMKNFAEFRGKHLSLNLVLIKLQVSSIKHSFRKVLGESPETLWNIYVSAKRPATVLKKSFEAGVFL